MAEENLGGEKGGAPKKIRRVVRIPGRQFFFGQKKKFIWGQKKVDEAFKELGASILSVFLKMAIELAAQQALALIAQKFIGGAVATTMSGIGAAAAVPAALVSLATFGTNAVAASAGIASTTALAVGLAAGSAAGSIPGAEEGGTVRRSGLTLVGESGPEILSLPRAAQITPLDPASGVI